MRGKAGLCPAPAHRRKKAPSGRLLRRGRKGYFKKKVWKAGLASAVLPTNVIIGLRSNSAHFIGKEVGTMNHIFAFMTSVAANVVSHFVCKWLDGWFKDRKH